MGVRERVVQIIGDAITAEVMATAFNEIVGGLADGQGKYAVDVEKVAEAAAGRLEAEGLIR
jgi:hypothetical protein